MSPLALILTLSAAAVASAEDLVLSLGDELELDDFPGAMATAVYALDISGSAVAQADSIELPNGEVLQYRDCPLDDGDYKTYEFENSGSEAELTVGSELDDVNGDVVDKDGQAYEISYVGDGNHAWFVMDMEALEKLSNKDEGFPDDPPGDQDRELRSILLDRGISQADLDTAYQKGLSDQETMAQLSVKVYFTQEYEAATSDVRGTIENIVAMTNQGFINSGVKINLNLLCAERYIGPEITDGYTMFDEFSKYKVTKERLHGTSDLTFLLAKSSNYCGIGSYKTTNFPISYSQKWCAESYYTITHELGHNLGAHHDEAQVGDLGGSYGRGFLMGTTNKRTNMAYNSDSAHGHKLNYYSDDVNSDSEGDSLGNALADNSRMIQERRFMYELIGDESANCPWTFEPDLTTGIIAWSAWENYGCLDKEKPMTRTSSCQTKYFACDETQTDKQEIKYCGDCTNNYSSCDYWKNVGYCEHSYVGFMTDHCKFSCRNLCERECV